MSNRMRCFSALAGMLLAYPAMAQMAPPQASPEAKTESQQFQLKLNDVIRALDKEPRLQDLTEQQRKDLIEFVTGNMLFALLHELGHAHIQEMGLPVLGREEDAADSYAIAALLKMATDVSDGVLVAATKGWFLDAERNQKENTAVPYYDAHSVDKVRAYQIVCLMVGSDLDKFAKLADEVKMPQDRQESCAGDYSNASWSWEMALKPHLRAADHPKQKVGATWGAPGEYTIIAEAMKRTGMIEMLVNYAANRFVWRRPIGFDIKSCGQPDLHWDLSNQKILVCYEMAQDFANLYRGYGLTYVMKPQEPKAKFQPAITTIPPAKATVQPAKATNK
jgi:Putative metallopeptidase